jgi:hypothetical protein
MDWSFAGCSLGHGSALVYDCGTVGRINGGDVDGLVPVSILGFPGPMTRNLYRVFIWLAFAGLNLIILALVDRWFAAGYQSLRLLRQGLWICVSMNGFYLLLWTGPWATPNSRIIQAASFLPLVHLLLNLLGILVFYQMGGLQNRHTGLWYAAVVLVHLVFVKWALLSILRPRSKQVK